MEYTRKMKKLKEMSSNKTMMVVKRKIKKEVY